MRHCDTFNEDADVGLSADIAAGIGRVHGIILFAYQ